MLSRFSFVITAKETKYKKKEKQNKQTQTSELKNQHNKKIYEIIEKQMENKLKAATNMK